LILRLFDDAFQLRGFAASIFLSHFPLPQMVVDISIFRVKSA